MMQNVSITALEVTGTLASHVIIPCSSYEDCSQTSSAEAMIDIKIMLSSSQVIVWLHRESSYLCCPQKDGMYNIEFLTLS